MALWKGKSKGNAGGYRFFVWILNTFGISSAYLILYPVVAYFFVFSGTSRRELFFLYRNRLGFSSYKSYSLVFRNFFSLGQSLIDKIAIKAGIGNRFSFHFDGEENLRDIVSQKKGAILLSGHIGNWDIAGFFLKRLQTRINIVIFDGEHEQIKAYLEKVAGGDSVHVITLKEDLSHIYQISEALKNNELVCMHADRFLEGNKIKEIPFLKTPAKFPLGPFILAATFRVPVSFVFAVKESKFHYHLFSSKPIQYDTGNKDELIKKIMADYAKSLENKLQTYPEQWFNHYPFWN